MKPNFSKQRGAVITPATDRFFRDIYHIYKFSQLFFKEAFTPPYKGKEIVKRNVPSDIAVEELINLLKENDVWIEQEVFTN